MNLARFLGACLVGGIGLGLLIAGLLVAIAKAEARYADLDQGRRPEDLG